MAAQTDDIQVASKIDLNPNARPGVSGKTGQGISKLISDITDILESRTASAATVTRERHRLAIERAIAALNEAENEIALGQERAEFAAEELRDAVRALDSLVGLVDVEHILDEIFSSFCIGK